MKQALYFIQYIWMQAVAVFTGVATGQQPAWGGTEIFIISI